MGEKVSEKSLSPPLSPQCQLYPNFLVLSLGEKKKPFVDCNDVTFPFKIIGRWRKIMTLA
jgi:hypothetical protein